MFTLAHELAQDICRRLYVPINVSAVEAEASYTCDACGEEIVVPIDATGGRQQEYVEDCPVCCRPHVLFVHVDADGHATIDARQE